MQGNDLDAYRARSGRFVAVWTLEIQTVIEDVDKILDAVIEVYPFGYGRYQRNAGISAEGMETAQPLPGSTSDKHIVSFEPGVVETFPMVELKITLERDTELLALVMDAIHFVHHYEEPVIFLREDWVSRANYNPDNNNPNRFWNNGRGLPNRILEIGPRSQ